MARLLRCHSRSQSGNSRWAFIWSSKASGPLPSPPFTAELSEWTTGPWSLWPLFGKVSRLDPTVLGARLRPGSYAFSLVTVSAGEAAKGGVMGRRIKPEGLEVDDQGRLIVKLSEEPPQEWCNFFDEYWANPSTHRSSVRRSAFQGWERSGPVFKTNVEDF